MKQQRETQILLFQIPTGYFEEFAYYFENEYAQLSASDAPTSSYTRSTMLTLTSPSTSSHSR